MENRSDSWINGSSRLENAVGKKMADNILLEGYGRELVYTNYGGSTSSVSLDMLGNVR